MSQNRFDPADFADPVALATDWSYHFHTHVDNAALSLSRPRADRLKFGISWKKRLMSALVLALSFALMIWSTMGLMELIHCFSQPEDPHPSARGLVFISCLAGILFVFLDPQHVTEILLLVLGSLLLTGWFVWRILQPVLIFDKGKDQLRGRLQAKCTLSEIHALQLLSVSEPAHTGRLRALYQLNLVFADGVRLPLISESRRESLQANAEALAEFLGKPLWNALDTTRG